MSCNPRELKRFRRFPVPASSLEAGREKLLVFMKEMPVIASERLVGFGVRWRLAAVMLVVTVFVTSGAGVVAAAHVSLPGDAFYPVKLAGEELHERIALSATQKFMVQSAHAARRLKETERLMERNGLTQPDRIARVQAAVRAYEKQLFAMNDIAIRLGAEQQEPETGFKAVLAAERIFDHHAELIASATAAQPAIAAAILEPLEDELRLQSDVMELMPEEHRQERAEKLKRRLKDLRLELAGDEDHDED